MKRLIYSAILVLSPLVMIASGDTIQTVPSPTKRWNIIASVGYGFPFSKQVLGGEATVDSNSAAVGKLIRGTFGKGIFSFVSVGYKINQHWGSEIGIYSNWGQKIMTSKVTNLYTGTGNQTFKQVSTNGIFVGFFMTETYSKFHISLHNDFLVGVINRATEEYYSSSIQYPTWKYYGRVSYGWLGRIGSSYDLSDKLNIGLNSFFLLHSWSPKEGNTLNGGNKITFTDNTSVNGIVQTPANQLTRITFPLHIVGVNVFVGYNF